MNLEISFFDFKNLSEKDQCQLVFAQGQLMSERSIQDLRFLLYRFPNFLVELTYQQKNNTLASFNVYQNNYLNVS